MGRAKGSPADGNRQLVIHVRLEQRTQLVSRKPVVCGQFVLNKGQLFIGQHLRIFSGNLPGKSIGTKVISINITRTTFLSKIQLTLLGPDGYCAFVRLRLIRRVHIMLGCGDPVCYRVGLLWIRFWNSDILPGKGTGKGQVVNLCVQVCILHRPVQHQFAIFVNFQRVTHNISCFCPKNTQEAVIIHLELITYARSIVLLVDDRIAFLLNCLNQFRSKSRPFWQSQDVAELNAGNKVFADTLQGVFRCPRHGNPIGEAINKGTAISVAPHYSGVGAAKRFRHRESIRLGAPVYPVVAA